MIDEHVQIKSFMFTQSWKLVNRDAKDDILQSLPIRIEPVDPEKV